MSRYRWLRVALAGSLAALIYNQAAAAHVLLVDQRANLAAVVHVDPEDDPIAGEPSRLYFDIQDDKSTVRVPTSAYRLVITDDKDNQVNVVTHATGSKVGAEYVFPRQGLYRLSLRANPNFTNGQVVSLENSVRVSRGGESGPAADRYPIANIVLWASIVALILLLIQVFNNRRDIVLKGKL